MEKRNVKIKGDLLEDEEYDEEEFMKEIEKENKNNDEQGEGEGEEGEEGEDQRISKKERNFQRERDYHSKLKQ